VDLRSTLVSVGIRPDFAGGVGQSKGQRIMTADQLRSATVKGIDDALGSFLARRHIGAEGCRMLRAQRNYWAYATEEQVQKLLTLLQQEPMREEPEQETPCDE
jgi:hypothetical protein